MPQKSSGSGAVLAIVIFLILVVVGVAVWYFVIRKKEPAPQPSTTVTPPSPPSDPQTPNLVPSPVPSAPSPSGFDLTTPMPAASLTPQPVYTPRVGGIYYIGGRTDSDYIEVISVTGSSMVVRYFSSNGQSMNLIGSFTYTFSSVDEWTLTSINQNNSIASTIRFTQNLMFIVSGSQYILVLQAQAPNPTQAQAQAPNPTQAQAQAPNPTQFQAQAPNPVSSPGPAVQSPVLAERLYKYTVTTGPQTDIYVYFVDNTTLDVYIDNGFGPVLQTSARSTFTLTQDPNNSLLWNFTINIPSVRVNYADSFSANSGKYNTVLDQVSLGLYTFLIVTDNVDIPTRAPTPSRPPAQPPAPTPSRPPAQPPAPTPSRPPTQPPAPAPTPSSAQIPLPAVRQYKNVGFGGITLYEIHVFSVNTNEIVISYMYGTAHTATTGGFTSGSATFRMDRTTGDLTFVSSINLQVGVSAGSIPFQINTPPNKLTFDGSAFKYVMNQSGTLVTFPVTGIV